MTKKLSFSTPRNCFDCLIFQPVLTIHFFLTVSYLLFVNRRQKSNMISGESLTLIMKKGEKIFTRKDMKEFGC